MSLRRALLLLIAFVLVAALLPAGLLLEHRLAGAIEEQSRHDLQAAPALLAGSRAQSADAMMMHAKEVATTDGLAASLLAGDDARAVQLVESARGGYGEEAVLLNARGRVLTGPAPPAALIERARAGEMPVEVVGDSLELRTVALAPVHAGNVFAGIAGITSRMGANDARALAGLTRADVVILTRRGGIAASTAAERDTSVIAQAARSWAAGDSLVHVLGADHHLLARAVPLGEFATAILVRDLDRDRAILSTLRRVATLSTGLSALVALILGAFFAMRLAEPARSVALAADRLAAGDFHAPLERPHVAELGRVVDAFEAMRRALAARLEELARANRELEDRQTRLSALQAELMQRDRLAAAGQLVAQLAHEIRNPVANVRNCLEVIRRRSGADAEIRAFADLAIDELLRMHELAEQMLDLHRPHDPGASASDAGVIVREVAALARVGAPPALRITTQVAEDGAVGIAPDALKQVLLNLVRNAREAMNDRGAIEIALHQEADTAVIDVADTGPGLAPDVLSRVFDPFFTTKGEVQGVGLGLFVAEGMVRGVGGRMSASNRTDRAGARFTITLPRIRTTAGARGSSTVSSDAESRA